MASPSLSSIGNRSPRGAAGVCTGFAVAAGVVVAVAWRKHVIEDLQFEWPVALGFAIAAFLLYFDPKRVTRRVAFLCLIAMAAAGVPLQWSSAGVNQSKFVALLWVLAVSGFMVGLCSISADYFNPQFRTSLSPVRIRTHLLLSILGALLVLTSLAENMSDAGAGWQLYHSGWITSDNLVGGGLYLAKHDVGGWIYESAGRILYSISLLSALAILIAVVRRMPNPQPLPHAFARLATLAGTFATVDIFFGWHNLMYHEQPIVRWCFLVLWLAGWLAATAGRVSRVALLVYFPLLVLDLSTIPALFSSDLRLYGLGSFMGGAQLLALAQLPVEQRKN